MYNIDALPDLVAIETGRGSQVEDPRRALVARICASGAFRKSVRLQRFLSYACDRALDGHPEQINEQQIGVQVFGKRADYHPAEDSTVRVQARLLRQKLEEYFSNEGSQEWIRITIPKGAYVPIFKPRDPDGSAAPEPGPAIPRRSRWALVAIIWFAVSMSAIAWLWSDNRRLRSWFPSNSAGFAPLTSFVVQASKPTTVVSADTGLVVAQALANMDIRLEDYSGRAYRRQLETVPVPNQPAFWRFLLSRYYTSSADALTYGKVLRLHPEFQKQIELRHARDLQTRDFREGNFILLGSPHSNPWVDLFREQLTFHFTKNPTTGTGSIANRAARTGEPAEFVSEPTTEGAGRSYGYVALTPNLWDTGNVLILAGMSTAATEAAADFACLPDASRRLARIFGVRDLGKTETFEVILEISLVGNAAKLSRIVAHRHTQRR